MPQFGDYNWEGFSKGKYIWVLQTDFRIKISAASDRVLEQV
jgi:hypothetical protein